jgi:putative PEP-CTERM system TPR-repeat lipoprotein
MTVNVPLRPLVLAIAFTLPLAGCWEKSPESRIESAKQALQKSDAKTAVVELKSLLQKMPGNAEARMLLGQTFQDLGQWDNSEKELRKAMELGVPVERLLPLLAKTLVKLGKHKEVAELVIPKAGLSSQALASVQAEKANALIAQNKSAEAAAMISEGEQSLAAVGGGALSNDLQLAKARLAVLNKQSPQALSLLGGILQRDAKFVDALFLKGQILQTEGKNNEALQTYQQIVSAKPGDFLANLSIAELKLQVNDLAAAEQAILTAEKSEPNSLLLKYLHARLSLMKKDFKKANEYLQQVLRVAPEHLPSVILDAGVSYGLGNYEQSLKSASKVLAQMPESPYATKLVASNELRRGNAKVALSLLLPLVQKYPNDLEMVSLLGEAYLKSNDFENAMQYFDRAAALQPQSSNIKQRQAQVHLGLGQKDQAVLELEQAVKLGEKSGQADIALIMLFINHKEFAKAQQWLDQLEKKLPNNPVTSNLSGLAYIGQNDRASARKAFEKALSIQPDFFRAATNLAKLDLAEGKPDLARKRFESVLEKDGKNIQAMMALAELASANKQDQEFLGWLDKAIKADPKALEPRAALVRHYLAKKNPQRALSLAREAVSIDPENAQSYSLLGSAQMATGDKAASLSSFVRVADKAPDNAESFYRLAAAQIANNKINDGRMSFEKALELKSDHAGALDGLLLIDVTEKKFDRALQRARAFQKKNPGTSVGLLREAEVLSRQGQFAQAAKVFGQAYSIDSDLNSFALMQSAYAKAGDQKTADLKLAELMAKSGENQNVQSFAAVYAMGLGRHAESVRIFERLLKSNPNNPAILNNLALGYLRINDPRALQTAEQSLKLAPNMPDIMDTVGWIHVQQGRAAKGVELLQKAADLAPKSASIRYHLAYAMSKAGKPLEAKRVLEALIKAGERFNEEDDAKKLLKSL